MEAWSKGQITSLPCCSCFQMLLTVVASPSGLVSTPHISWYILTPFLRTPSPSRALLWGGARLRPADTQVVFSLTISSVPSGRRPRRRTTGSKASKIQEALALAPDLQSPLQKKKQLCSSLGHPSQKDHLLSPKTHGGQVLLSNCIPKWLIKVFIPTPFSAPMR